MSFKTFEGIESAEENFEGLQEEEPEPPCLDPDELDDPVKVEWFCGLSVGLAHWQGTEIYEPDECYGEGTFWVEREDWEQGAHHIHCGVCGQYLEDDSHYEKKS